MTVSSWKREESRFLWPLLSFFIVAIGAGLGIGVIFAQPYFRFSTDLFLTILGLNFATPIGAGVLLFLFFRSRDRRLNRQAEQQILAARPLPANLIEASLLELAETDQAVLGIGRRIWWTVFLACCLSLVVAEYLVSVSSLLFTTLTQNDTLNPFYSRLPGFVTYYGLILVIAGLFISANVVYWRRVQRRLKDLRAETERRRTALSAFEQNVWEQV